MATTKQGYLSSSHQTMSSGMMHPSADMTDTNALEAEAPTSSEDPNGLLKKTSSIKGLKIVKKMGAKLFRTGGGGGGRPASTRQLQHSGTDSDAFSAPAGNYQSNPEVSRVQQQDGDLNGDMFYGEEDFGDMTAPAPTSDFHPLVDHSLPEHVGGRNRQSMNSIHSSITSTNSSAVRASVGSLQSSVTSGISRTSSSNISRARSNNVTSVCHDYTDHADIPDSEQGIAPEMDVDNTLRKRNTGGVITPFPERLHEMLTVNQHPDIVSWAPHGRCFLVRRPRDFETTVMPLHFNHTKITSFQRQLNLYGFKRITRGVDRGAYYHELFLRGRPKLCTRMRRQKVKGTGHKPLPDPDNEPNFYAMKPVGDSPAGVVGQAPAAQDGGQTGSPLQGSGLSSSFQGDLDQPQEDYSRSYLAQLKRGTYGGQSPQGSQHEQQLMQKIANLRVQQGSQSSAAHSFASSGRGPAGSNSASSAEVAAISAMAFGTSSPGPNPSSSAGIDLEAVAAAAAVAAVDSEDQEDNGGANDGGRSGLQNSFVGALPGTVTSAGKFQEGEHVPTEVSFDKGRRRNSATPLALKAMKMFRRSSVKDMITDDDQGPPSSHHGHPRRGSVSALSRGSSGRARQAGRRRSQTSIEMNVNGAQVEMGHSCRRLSQKRLSITSIGSFNRRLSVTSIGTGTMGRRGSIMSWDSCGSLDALDRLDVEQNTRRASITHGNFPRRSSVASGNGLHAFKEQLKAQGADLFKALSTTSEDWINDNVHNRRHSLNAQIDFDGLFDEDGHLLDGDAASV